MKSLHCAVVAGLLLALLAAPGRGVQVRYRSDYHPDPAEQCALTGEVVHRLEEATSRLRRVSDCRLDPQHDSLRVVLGYAREDDGSILPACYTFPDSAIRVVPEYVRELDGPAAEEVLRRFVRLEEPLDTILQRCSPKQRAQVPAIVSDFLVAELMHECYHDWQNRRARYPVVEQGRTLLIRARAHLGPDWRGFLESQGVDLREHDREMNQAELECCSVQAVYWRSVYGPEPLHPLARALLHLIDAGAGWYRERLGGAGR